MNTFYSYPIETRLKLERIAHHIAFTLLHGDTALIGLYLAHVRRLPHSAMVACVLALIEDMSHE